MARRVSDGPLSSGERTTYATFQNPDGPPVPDGDGGYTQAYLDLDPPTLWVRVAPATAADLERVAAGTVLSQATHIVIGPFHPDVTTKTRMTWIDRHERTHAANITGVSSVEERNIEMILVASEVVL